ncbi:MAG TPA: DUF2254 domain-containing protein [Burkholderiales bacterium]|nr:DUF2254 domain-containing protein [Burkholderiales bacterium]
MSRLRALWWRVRSSLWLVPGLLVLAATLLAAGLVEAGGLHELDLQRRWPRLFGTGAEGARSLLSAIATSMLTVAGTVFSITLAVLSLAASQYSPRVLRTFMDDRPTQLVLGVLVAVFVYCLVVLRTIRGGQEPFVPSLAVLGGIVLAFVAVGFLVFFIHHLASSIEAPSILDRVAHGTDAAVEELFPEELGAEADESAVDASADGIRAWAPVPAEQTGYIVSLDNEALLSFAQAQDRVVRMELAIGDYALKGQPVAWLEGTHAVDGKAQRSLNACYSYDRQRTIEQDAAFGLQQLVDVALKALSSGMNDQSTAVLCIDRLTEVLVRLARRRIETPYRRDDTALRVIAIGPSFTDLVGIAFTDVRESGADKATVLERLLWSLERIGDATANIHRRKLLADEAARIAETAGRAIASPHERARVVAQARELERRLRR